MELTEAIKMAAEVHGTQADRGGEPYIFHVMRVAERMGTQEERVVGILHDVLEDCERRRVAEYMSRIFHFYGQAVLEACASLDHNSNEPYMDYIRRLAKNPLAKAVKMADLADNTNSWRLMKLPSPEQQRLCDKYYEAMDYLATADLSLAAAPPEK